MIGRNRVLSFVEEVGGDKKGKVGVARFGRRGGFQSNRYLFRAERINVFVFTHSCMLFLFSWRVWKTSRAQLDAAFLILIELSLTIHLAFRMPPMSGAFETRSRAQLDATSLTLSPITHRDVRMPPWRDAVGARRMFSLALHLSLAFAHHPSVAFTPHPSLAFAHRPSGRPLTPSHCTKTGTGKTLLAKAAATETGATFIELKISDVVRGEVGESEKVRGLFSVPVPLLRTSLSLSFPPSCIMPPNTTLFVLRSSHKGYYSACLSRVL